MFATAMLFGSGKANQVARLFLVSPVECDDIFAASTRFALQTPLWVPSDEATYRPGYAGTTAQRGIEDKCNVCRAKQVAMAWRYRVRIRLRWRHHKKFTTDLLRETRHNCRDLRLMLNLLNTAVITLAAAPASNFSGSFLQIP